MAGAGAERQETGFVNAVNNAVKKHGGPIRVMTQGGTLNNIAKAYKYGGRSAAGTEPYTDVVLETKSGKKWNLSMKGDSAPSLAGGGLEGLEMIVPGISGRFLKRAYSAYVRKGYKSGDDIPDAYANIPTDLVGRIVKGNIKMGGPIHYMYIGGMDVKSSYSNGTLSIQNAKLITASAFSTKYKLVFRLRRRRAENKFLLENEAGGRDKRGLPMITKGRRIVTVDKMPSDAFKVRL